MSNSQTKAKFWKCALQVNPFDYIKYRGGSHNLSESDYNNGLAEKALESGIKIIGFADHGNVDKYEALCSTLVSKGIIVFPGFEIASSEKVHFVCLYPESTTSTELNRYLGSLHLLDPEDGIRPSKLSAEQLMQVVDEHGGLLYAAHCIDDSGLLKRKLNHIWKCKYLKAAQIPNTVESLRGIEEDFYRKVIKNITPEYQRDVPVAIINAKDVAHPNDLTDPRASCLIKMTIPSFAAFKLAFQDPESRIRLNSDVSDAYYSQLESLKVIGGYLDGLEIDFSEHLNTIIGGRGTGKSTLIECVRYVLNLKAIGKNAQKQHDEIIKENLGKAKARVEIVIRSSKMNGKRFRLARRFGEGTIIQDMDENISSFSSTDLLPTIEIFGQNEIYEIAQDPVSQRKLLNRFLSGSENETEAKIHDTIRKMKENRQVLTELNKEISDLEEEVTQLPKLNEQIHQYRNLGIEEKLKNIPLLESTKRLSDTVTTEKNKIKNLISSIKQQLPTTDFLKDSALTNILKPEEFKKIRNEFQILNTETESLITEWDKKYTTRASDIELILNQIKIFITEQNDLLDKSFKELPDCEGKSGTVIGNEYQGLMKRIESIKPKEEIINQKRLDFQKYTQERNALLSELSKFRAQRSASFSRDLKQLNKRLNGKLRLYVKTEANKQPLMDFLRSCRLEGIGDKTYAKLQDNLGFSPVRLAELIRLGATALRDEGWGITPSVADAFARLAPSQLWELEEIELPDTIDIELNTAHEGMENFRELKKLSTGQQCTAILHLLLLENKDPLVMDQPEDNLDNAFIADRIVAELRNAKISRQFIFATHNANIPVFGDAEWIGVFEAFDNQATMPFECQGAIDVPVVRDQAAAILEGGKAAFNQRRIKYGY